MADHTDIEWTDATWNPIRGCTRVSEGCRGCYAEAIAARFSDVGAPYHGFAERGRPGSKWTGRVEMIWPLIDLPLRWARPRRIFPNSMSDLFHENLPVDEIATLYAVMVAAVHLRGHTFQPLTKRTARMRRTLNDPIFWEQVNAEASALAMEYTDPLHRHTRDARATLDEYGPDNPPPGIWHGTSVENQAAADERIPELRSTPASVRFLSIEPLIGPVKPDLTGIDWVIVGGESGPSARPMHPDWARSLRDQCAAAGVPFFFKQNGEFVPVMTGQRVDFWALADGSVRVAGLGNWGDVGLQRVGKKRAGNTLDGRQHLEFPA